MCTETKLENLNKAKSRIDSVISKYHQLLITVPGIHGLAHTNMKNIISVKGGQGIKNERDQLSFIVDGLEDFEMWHQRIIKTHDDAISIRKKINSWHTDLGTNYYATMLINSYFVKSKLIHKLASQKKAETIEDCISDLISLEDGNRESFFYVPEILKATSSLYTAKQSIGVIEKEKQIALQQHSKKTVVQAESMRSNLKEFYSSLTRMYNELIGWRELCDAIDKLEMLKDILIDRLKHPNIEKHSSISEEEFENLFIKDGPVQVWKENGIYLLNSSIKTFSEYKNEIEKVIDIWDNKYKSRITDLIVSGSTDASLKRILKLLIDVDKKSPNVAMSLLGYYVDYNQLLKENYHKLTNKDLPSSDINNLSYLAIKSLSTVMLLEKYGSSLVKLGNANYITSGSKYLSQYGCKLREIENKTDKKYTGDIALSFTNDLLRRRYNENEFSDEEYSAVEAILKTKFTLMGLGKDDIDNCWTKFLTHMLTLKQQLGWKNTKNIPLLTLLGRTFYVKAHVSMTPSGKRRCENILDTNANFKEILD